MSIRDIITVPDEILKKIPAPIEKVGVNEKKLINDGEIGLAMLRIIEIIGEDELKDLGSETLYFLVNALNQMDIDLIRNEILSEILPVRV